jgi:hypothetical protein
MFTSKYIFLLSWELLISSKVLISLAHPFNYWSRKKTPLLSHVKELQPHFLFM